MAIRLRFKYLIGIKKFLSTNVYPIDSYIDRLVELNKVLTPSFSSLGCYKDKWDRAMVHLKNGVDTITECQDLCHENGYYLFGLQYPPAGQCFCSNDKDEAMQFGESDNCDDNGRGGVWALNIYQSVNIPWVAVTKNDITSTIASNVDVNAYNDADGHLVVDGTLQARGCGSGDKINFGVLLADSLGGIKWRKIRYTMEFVSGSSSCWSILGDTDAAPEHGLFGLKTIDNGLKYGNWDGEKRRCDNEVDNFLHVKHGNGHKGYLTVEQMRDINVDQAGIASGFSCTHVGSVVRFKDISVAYYNNGDNDDEYIRIGNVELHYGVKYAIKSVSSGFYLDGRNQNYNNPLLTNRNPKGDKYLHWTIVPTNVKNQFALKSVSSGFYLDGRNQNYNNPLITNRDPTNDYHLQWTFEKTNGGTYTPEYMYIGCYKDSGNRALRYGPHQWGYTPDTCST